MNHFTQIQYFIGKIYTGGDTFRFQTGVQHSVFNVSIPSCTLQPIYLKPVKFRKNNRNSFGQLATPPNVTYQASNTYQYPIHQFQNLQGILYFIILNILI